VLGDVDGHGTDLSGSLFRCRLLVLRDGAVLLMVAGRPKHRLALPKGHRLDAIAAGDAPPCPGCCSCAYGLLDWAQPNPQAAAPTVLCGAQERAAACDAAAHDLTLVHSSRRWPGVCGQLSFATGTYHRLLLTPDGMKPRRRSPRCPAPVNPWFQGPALAPLLLAQAAISFLRSGTRRWCVLRQGDLPPSGLAHQYLTH